VAGSAGNLRDTLVPNGVAGYVNQVARFFVAQQKADDIAGNRLDIQQRCFENSTRKGRVYGAGPKIIVHTFAIGRGTMGSLFLEI
jgi:hypothetical protein